MTSTGPSPAAETPLFEAVEGERRGEASRADGGGPPGVEAVGQGDDPLGRDPGQLGEASVVGHAEVVAVGDDLAAGRERGLAGVEHRADQIDAGHQRADPGHPVAGPGHHPVLVVDGRPVHGDDHRAVAELVGGEGPDPGLDTLPVGAGPGHDEGGERTWERRVGPGVRDRATGWGAGGHWGTVLTPWVERTRRSTGRRPTTGRPQPMDGGPRRGRRHARRRARSAGPACRPTDR